MPTARGGVAVVNPMTSVHRTGTYGLERGMRWLAGTGKDKWSARVATAAVGNGDVNPPPPPESLPLPPSDQHTPPPHTSSFALPRR